jgi:threonine/homoserine/homoserine lactone efflux protein
MALRESLMAAKVVADRSVVDHEQRPDVVRMRRVGVVREPRLEDLADTRDRRLPGSDGGAFVGSHDRRIVQDASRPPRYRLGMERFIALVGFSFASSVTPGPNNVLLWASGASFGLRRTLPHVFGTAVGIGTMTLAVAAASGAILAAIPGLATAMKFGGTLYLLWLAWQILRAGALERTDVARPFGLISAAAFQLINPKAWIFALGAVTTFRPTDMSLIVGSLFVAVTMMVVIVPSALLWAGLGDALGRLVRGRRARRAVSLALAALLLLSVALVWI